MANEEGDIEGRIVAELNSARTAMRGQRFYLALTHFRRAEQLILSTLPHDVFSAGAATSPPPELNALVLRGIYRIGAEWRARRTDASTLASRHAKMLIAPDVSLADTDRQAEALREAAVSLGQAPHADAAVRATADFKPATLVDPDRPGQLLRPGDPDPARLPEELARFYFYDIPLGMADCLVELEQEYDKAIALYLKVVAYAASINELPIAAPDMWLRLAEAHLARGDAAYRSENLETARRHYEAILKNGRPPSDSPLYDGALGIMIAKVRLWLPVAEKPESLSTLAAPPSARHLLALARARQRILQLDAKLDVFGHDANWRPILSFAYLQEIARTFAQVAASANREYVANTVRAEQETQTVRQLEQSVVMADAGEQIERARLDETQRELEATQAAEQLARRRAQLARDNYSNYAAIGPEIVALDSAIAWSNVAVGTPQRQSYRGLEWLGVSGAVQDRDDLVHQLTGLRSNRAYRLERDRLRNAELELNSAATAAAAQTQTSIARVGTARTNLTAARWRTQMSRDLLALAEGREMNAEMFFDLAVFARQSAQIYLDRAIAAARQMELAFNFENNATTRRIRADYGDISGAGGLMAADLLLRDIDSFVQDLLALASSKDQLMVQSISLRREFPLEFQTLLRTGEMVFQTTLDQFHQTSPGQSPQSPPEQFDGGMPGLYNGRIKRVDVDLTTMGSGRNLRGSLACAGVSTYRDSQGQDVRKVHSAETMIFSPMKMEGSVSQLLSARARANQLELFENVGLATSWRLALPLDANDIDLQATADITLLVTYVCRHDAALEARDLAARPTQGSAQIGIGLREQGVDAAGEKIWKLLEAEGEAEFRIDPGWLPRYAVAPKVTSIVLVCVRKGGKPLALRARFAGEGVGDLQHVFEPANNATIIEKEETPGAFHGAPLDRRWTLRLDLAENPELRGQAGAVLDLGKLHDIHLVYTYDFTFRRA